MTDKPRDTLTVHDLFGGYRTRKTRHAQEAALSQPAHAPSSLHESLKRSATDRKASPARPLDAEHERDAD